MDLFNEISMYYAKRTNWNLAPNTLTRLTEDLRQAGGSFLDLTESNPTHCGFSYPGKQILNALAKTDNLDYSPSARGLVTTRETICHYYQERGIAIDPQNIFLTSSTSEAYSFLFRLLADPGDKILLPTPSYPLFEFLCGLNDLSTSTYQLVYDHNGWRPDLEKFRQSIEGDPRAIVLVNPNNPTGSFIQEGDFVVLNALCQERHIPIISDEVFFDYGYDWDRKYFSALHQAETLSFVLGGVSKSLGLPQMKLSWIIINGPDEIVLETSRRLEIIADTYLSASIPIQNALREWFKLQPFIQKKIKERVSVNRQWLCEQIAQKEDCQYLKADGGWYAILKLPPTIQEEEFVISLLKNDHILVYPGYYFDFADSPYIVMSLLPRLEDFKKAGTKILERIT